MMTKPSIKTSYQNLHSVWAQCSHHGINWAMMMRRLWWWTPALGLQKLPLPYSLFQGVQRQMGNGSLPLWITAGEWQACPTCPLHFSTPPAIELHFKYLKVVKHSTSGLELVLLIVWRKKRTVHWQLTVPAGISHLYAALTLQRALLHWWQYGYLN